MAGRGKPCMRAALHPKKEANPGDGRASSQGSESEAVRDQRNDLPTDACACGDALHIGTRRVIGVERDTTAAAAITTSGSSSTKTIVQNLREGCIRPAVLPGYQRRAYFYGCVPQQ